MIKLLSALLLKLRILKVFSFLSNNFQPTKGVNGRLVCPFVMRRKVQNFQILVYHRVNDEGYPFYAGMPVKIFRKQMEYLCSDFNVIDLEQAVERMKRKDVPDKTVVITFDDGYRDNFENAFPILNELSISATIFLATEAIGSNTVLWHDRVVSAVRRTKVGFLRSVPDELEGYALRTNEEKRSSLTEILKFLRSMGDDERSFWIDRLMKKLEVEDLKESTNLMLTWDQVKIMNQNGISFGSHTVTHPVLSKITSVKVEKELQESKEIIEKKLGTVVKTFAYPSGRKEDLNENIKIAVKRAGYMCGLTTIFGTNEESQDVFELRRIHPWETYIPGFALKLHWYKFRF